MHLMAFRVHGFHVYGSPPLSGWPSIWRRMIDRYEELTHYITASVVIESIMLHHKITDRVGFLQAYHAVRAGV